MSFSKGRSSSASGRSLAGANMLSFASRNRVALAMVIVLCGSAVCLLYVERNEQYTDPVSMDSRIRVTTAASRAMSLPFSLVLDLVNILLKAIPALYHLCGM
jgi:hypothetical protein